MSTAIAQRTDNHITAPDIERVLIQGDLSKLTPEQRITYYRDVCASVGLNPLTQPFQYLTLSGKLVLYARKDATEQIRATRGVSLRITDRQLIDDVYVVTAEATDRTGRVDSATGAVAVGNLKGEPKANALMKAETKAKRRVTLSIAGLGMLDETEVESIPDARPAPVATSQPIPGYTPMSEVVDTTTGEVSDFFEGIPTGLLTEEQIGELTNRARAASPLCEAKLLAAYRVGSIEEIPASEYDNALARIEKFAAAARAKK